MDGNEALQAGRAHHVDTQPVAHRAPGTVGADQPRAVDGRVFARVTISHNGVHPVWGVRRRHPLGAIPKIDQVAGLQFLDQQWLETVL